MIAFVAETVVGATAGAVPPVADYFKRIREICDRYGVLLILDEVMCGMGRTGTLHACEQDGIAPDLMTIAKGLGGGYQPIGATLLSRKIFDAVRQRLGLLPARPHLSRPPDGLRGGARRAGGHPARQPARQCAGHGRAARAAAATSASAIITMSATSAGAACSWRSSSSTTARRKAPFDPKLKLNARIKREAMARGLMVYPSGGTIDGARGDHVLIAPPFIVDAAAIDTIVERLGDAVDAAIAQRRNGARRLSSAKSDPQGESVEHERCI